MEAIRKDYRSFRVLLQSIPTDVTALFVLSVFAMNLMANKSIDVPVNWMALDGGIAFSWAVFLSMDVVTRHFGPKAATQLTVFTAFMNLFFCLLLYGVCRLPGMWGEATVPGSESAINAALDHTFGGTWYVMAGSMIAFITSAFVNNYLNHAIGRLLSHREPTYAVYATCATLSTAAGQYTDNLVFALLISRSFFGWTLTQCFVCAGIGMVMEVLCELAFSYVGYRIERGWRRDCVGAKYFDCIGKAGVAAQ